MNMACYKSALIDLDRRWANKGQAMNENIIKHFEMKLLWDSKRIMKGDKIIDVYMQPDRLRRVDTDFEKESEWGSEGTFSILNSEAIVGSANINEIAERGGNDLSPQ